MNRKLFAFLFLAVGSLTLTAVGQDPRTSVHQEGLRENRPDSVALVNARVVVSPGFVHKQASVVVRRGKIESVVIDPKLIPKDVHQIDLAGKTIYAGLIDAFTEFDVPQEQVESGAPYWNSNIRPQVRIADVWSQDTDLNKEFRQQGVTARLIAPSAGIIKGQSAVVSTGDAEAHQTCLNQAVAQHALLSVRRRGGGSSSRPSYPNSPMGAVALARQAMLDAQWYQKANQAVLANPLLPKPDRNDSLQALEPLIDQEQTLILDAANELYFLRAHRFAKEFNLKAMIKGSGLEFRRLDDVVKTGRSIILPVDFPSAPNVASFETALNVSLETLLEWDLAPENPKRLADAGVNFAFCSSGLDSRSDFLKNIRIAVDRGLPKIKALQALTTTPAQLFGVDQLVGTIERGKLANLIVVDGDLFDKDTQILETWVAGQRYQIEKPARLDLTGDWKLTSRNLNGKPLDLKLSLQAKGGQVKGSLEMSSATSAKQAAPKKSESKKSKPNTRKADRKSAAKKSVSKKKQPKKSSRKQSGSKKTKPKSSSQNQEDKDEEVKLLKAGLQDNRFSAAFDSTRFQASGISRMTFVFDDSQSTADGFLTYPDGTRFPARIEKLTSKAQPADEKSKSASRKSASRNSASKKSASRKSTTKDSSKDSTAENSSVKASVSKSDSQEASTASSRATYGVNYPLGSFGRSEPARTESVLIKNVTIWTCGPQGIINQSSVLLQNGKIAAVGTKVNPKSVKGLVVIDGSGMHLTPGIIDCHSHMASDGGINESGQAITAEVRIGDFINCNDVNIYRQLAGGVTCSNILHGSANPIGGQNQVIKLRWGLNDEQMKFAEAPQGIKFALGENVKRSRSRDSTRYPRTRMGVEQIFLDEFRAAKGYEQEWKRWNRTRTGLPPRRDLELDAIVEILNQKRWIHCHSYRQDEILALIRLLDGFNIQIGTFQHILEGYKVADAMKKHGAMGSAFSDWWAYKFEVYDAIPYAGALMHNAGVVVSFNSDDRELARHLNHEAAKAVKYGGVPPEEALKFVTLNPAKQLRIDQYVGSIEVGKHADVVLWSGDPLSTLSRCEKTWVDGQRMFDREEDQKQRVEFAKMKQTLIQKVLQSGQKMNSLPNGRRPKPAEMWPNYDEFCKCKGAK